MARIGYARVSTADQDLEVQQAKLKAEGCGIIRSEKVGVASVDRLKARAAIMGTYVSERMKAPTSANVTVSAIGRKNFPSIP